MSEHHHERRAAPRRELDRKLMSHVQGDQDRFGLLAWALIALFAVVAVLSIAFFFALSAARNATHRSEAATCVIVKVVEDSADREAAIVRKRPNLKTTNAHRKSRDTLNDIANRLRAEVHCPPRTPPVVR